MTAVVEVPSVLDDRALEKVLERVADVRGSRVLIDARRLRWADPYGLLGLLAVGHELGLAGPRPALHLPAGGDIAGLLTRLGFADRAGEIFEVHGASKGADDDAGSTVLGITAIQSHADVHRVMDSLQERAAQVLSERLGYSRVDAVHFSVVLSEVCQNIIEHAEAGGWVGIQSYKGIRGYERQAVVIGVVDLGVGFRGSLAREHSARFADRWSDAAALEAAFLHGVTRFRDPGRGQGLKQIRSRVAKWNGRVAIRSGTARIADVPDWDDTPPLERDLPSLGGSQIQIVLPARSA